MWNLHASSAEVAALVAEVNTAAKAFEVADEDDYHVARRLLQTQAKKLVASLEEPSLESLAPMFPDIAKDLGVFEKLEGSKTISLAEIVTSTGADEIMIVRIFRHLVGAGILADIPGPGYTITTLGLPYLNLDHRNCNNFVLEHMIPTILKMPHTLRERGYKPPTKASGSPFKWLFGEEPWTWMGSHPDRAAVMVSAMASIKADDISGGAYQFGTELARMDIKDDEVAIVDIGGGQGHILSDIRKSNPDIRGRFICQDLQSSFEAVSGPPPGVEFMTHDFFMLQPIQAHIYHIRHVLHDWDDEECRMILAQIVPRLRENAKSKLLLVDLVLPDANVSMQESIKDLNMYPFGGLERDVKQWTSLLDSVELKIKKIWRGSEPEAYIECELV